MAVQIKPLDWHSDPDLPHLFDAVGVGILYRVIERHDGTGTLRIVNMNRDHSQHPSADEAKAAAQEWHNSLIRSCIGEGN